MDAGLTSMRQHKRKNSTKRPHEHAGSGPDPKKIRHLIDHHPAFQLLTIDGLKWIDPHTLQCIDCPFGFHDTAFQWLMEYTPWREHPLRSLEEVQRYRWLLHIHEHIDFDERWRLFDPQGVWLNPFTGVWEADVRIERRLVNATTCQYMARTLALQDQQALKVMLSLDELHFIMRQRQQEHQDGVQQAAQQPKSEEIIAASERFEVKTVVFDEGEYAQKHSKPRLQPALSEIHSEGFRRQESNPTIVMPDAAAANRHHKLEREHYDFIDAPSGLTHSDTLTDETSYSSSHADVLFGRQTTNNYKAHTVNFAQESLLEEPTKNRPLQHKSGRLRESTRSGFEDLPGDQIAGYQIVSLLGTGGMGNVYKAVQMSMQREVAIKVLARELSNDDRFVSRFMREARASGRVNHPNVITCYDVGNDDGNLYMVLELVTGGDACQLITDSGGRLPVKRTMDIFLDCARGLNAIHAAGIIHRDIKPSNIFLADDGTAKIADLGLARSAAHNNTQITKKGMCVGTPAYMSPEQVMGKSELDIRSDIYSLGVTLFTMLAGVNPFVADDVWELFSQIVEHEPRDICLYCPDLDPQIIELINRCMDKKKRKRFQNPAELLTALDAIRQKNSLSSE